VRAFLDRFRGASPFLLAEVDAVAERAGVHRDQRDPVSEHVVHLARDAGALGGAGLCDACLLLALGGHGALSVGVD